jgi:hypothetical protein
MKNYFFLMLSRPLAFPCISPQKRFPDKARKALSSAAAGVLVAMPSVYFFNNNILK